MDSYPVDLDPEQVVRWLLAEQAAGLLGLRLNARRSTEIREIPARRELHLGDEEREDLSEVATIGTLEIAPQHLCSGEAQPTVETQNAQESGNLATRLLTACPSPGG
jgi:hypothetical protein